MDTINPFQDDRLLRWPQLQELIPLSRSHIYTLMARGEFPQSINLGPRSAAWLESEVNDWVQERLIRRASIGEQ